MPCCLLIVALFVPRITLIGMCLTGYAQQAFEGWLWPMLGWLFMPYTTCAYAIGMNEHSGFRGWSLALLIFGVILDVGGHSGSAYTRRYSVVVSNWNTRRRQ